MYCVTFVTRCVISDSKIGWFRRCLDVLEPLRISKGLLCVHMYYIMCIKSEQFIVYTLIVGRFHDQASPKTDSRLPNDAGSCYDASASLNSNNSNSLQLWTLDTEARNSQEDLAERSNIGSDFYRRKPASLSVSSCQEATSTPCSTQTLDCASGSGTQRMLRHDCMVATCLPRGGFAKSVWAWCPGV